MASGEPPTEPDAVAEGFLEQIPLHSTNLLTVLDEDGVVLYESPSIERVFGFEQSALVGDPVAAYFHPEDRAAVVGAFETVVGSEEHVVEAIEYRHECADGSYRWVESVAASNPTPAGHFVVNTRDVSDRRRRERSLRKRNERLDEFASIVSHDLRNPLNLAIGATELAREECDSEHMETIEDAHDRMAALIDDLLTLARSGTRADRLGPVDLDPLFEDCWRSVATADATLDMDVERTVLADRQRLSQLVENILRNAIEHAGPAPTVTVADVPDAGFYVADDGDGISPGRREEVFESGYTSTSDGTGLGLAIVDRIADAHDWVVDVSESQDGGARFEVTGVEFVD